jgi:hypothetical protein
VRRPRALLRPVTAADLTPAMLAPVQRAADRSKLPQTIWPSRWFGPDYQGEDCLLTAAAAHGLDVLRDRPHDAAAGSGPLLSVLPTGWLVR